MKNVIISLIGVAGVAAAANAQNLALSVKFSVDGGATWSSDVVANAGSVVQGAIFMSGDNVYGLGGGTMRMNGTGLIAGESAAFAAGTDTGRVGPFNFGAATNAIFATAGAFRIDASADAANTSTGAGMTFFQRDPSSGGANFTTANPALCFRFDIQTAVGADHSISVALDQLSRGVATYYSSSSATRPTTAAAALNGGTIRVVPTPATLALVGLGGLVATRRRTR
jgi:MYXO-CTERM domain-containing protein